MPPDAMPDLSAFSPLDLVGLVFFVGAWLTYGYAVQGRKGHRSLSRIMHGQRRIWAEQLISRDNRVVDTTINASLQNGTAFFASTSLIALGSVLTLSRSGDDVLSLFGSLPFGVATTRATWEVKVAGLAIVFVYAFFKFSWAYRLFNYGAILIGAVPPKGSGVDYETMQKAAHRAAAMNIAAGNHFDRGQRAFFFALAYLGWFVSAPVLIVSTAACVVVMWRRQFASEIRNALLADEEPRDGR
ncbi:membrane protein [Methylobacterium brachythecii]|uniref:Membrane protein n=2 Tax=Methylobacterium brachythecii TaxID=1176177 RepID=A0ABQ6DC29_9HYPH|nr:membrane protein [Methylobacterium brachythecii]